MKPTPTRLARLIRRHDGLLERADRLRAAIAALPDGHDIPGLTWLNQLLEGVLPQLDRGKSKTTLRQQLPLTLEKLRDDDGELEKAIGDALRVWLDKKLEIPGLDGVWASVVQAVASILSGLGARLLTWVLLKVVVGLTRQARLDAVQERIARLEQRARGMADELGVSLDGGNGQPLRARAALADRDDDDVFALLPLEVA